MFIDSEEIAGELLRTVREDLPRYTYRLQLDENDRLRWLYEYGDTKKVYTREPETGFWKRFFAGFYRLLPIESQL